MSESLIQEAPKKSWKLKYKRKFHGRIKEIEYESWHGMKSRCNNKKHKDYPGWGGRGIKYDPSWEDFTVFFADMGAPPSREYTLERKDNERDYCKENCIWLLKKHQTRNQRSTKLSMEKAREIRKKYAVGGETHRSLAIEYGVTYSTIGFVLRNERWLE